MSLIRLALGRPAPAIVEVPGPAEDRSPFRLLIQDPSPVFAQHPLFADHADGIWFGARAWNAIPPRVGLHRHQSFIRQEYDKFVVLHRYGEGVIFDEEGVCNSPGFLNNMQTMPQGMRRDGDSFVVGTEILDRAPRLAGNWIVFYNGNLQNYYHWLVEGMLALDVLDGPFSLANGTVLPSYLPAEGRFDHIQLMHLMGHDKLRIERITFPYARLDGVVHFENGDIWDYPISLLRAMQRRISQKYADADKDNRIYILRSGVRSVANQAQLDAVLAPLRFRSCRLEEMSLEAQIRLFSSASMVVSPHGAGLSNLLFASPGCKVIELMPESEMRPFFCYIGARLEHTYGMLPCPTHDGNFNGQMTVDIDKFRALLTMVMAQSRFP
jgi:hypothetical protein